MRWKLYGTTEDVNWVKALLETAVEEHPKSACVVICSLYCHTGTPTQAFNAAAFNAAAIRKVIGTGCWIIIHRPSLMKTEMSKSALIKHQMPMEVLAQT